MKTYIATFTGRLRGAIGIFYPCRVAVQGENEEAATLRLYDTHEHLKGLKLREAADALVLLVQNDRELYDAVRQAVESLKRAVDRAAEQFAKANADWHDDPEADDHAAFHAPAIVQLPREERTKALLELLERHLTVIAEEVTR